MRLRSQAGIVLAGNVLRAAGQFAVLAVLTRRAGDEEAGRYALSLAVTAMPFLFWNFNLRVVRSTEKGASYSSKTFSQLNLIGIALAGVTSVIAALVLGGSEEFLLIVVYAVARAGESISLLSYGSIQRATQGQLLGATLAGRGILTLLIAGFFTSSAATAVIAMAVGGLSYAVLVDIPLSRRATGLEDTHADGSLASLASTSVPLAFDALFSSAILTIPRLVVRETEGLAALAGFGLVVQLAFAAQLMAGSIGHVAVGRLSKLAATESSDAFNALLHRLRKTGIGLGLAVCLGGTLFTPLVFDLLGIEIANVRLLGAFAFLASGVGVFQRLTSRALQAVGDFSGYLALDGLMAAVSTVGAVVFVSLLGSHGGALAIALAFGIGAVATDLLVRRAIRTQSRMVTQ